MKFLVLSLLTALIFLLTLFVGSVHIPAQHVLDTLLGSDSYGAEGFIVMGSRLPMAVTAVFAGAGV